MSQVVLLDTGVLGLASNPRISANANACMRWIDSLLAAGDFPRVPAITDYEVRRELLRAGKTRGQARLDALIEIMGYLPLSPRTLCLAAHLWADARQRGRPTALDAALDADVILAAQAQEILTDFGPSVIVATGNVAHLSRYVEARPWQDIQPSQPPG
ncbi:MAG TPA: hypothetical protein VFE46_14815 [Pirellulales bacterium]|jgi:predicted nucleic acid-binding protein|nr:hypothetical protein [Pirellulales bacterium]